MLDILRPVLAILAVALTLLALGLYWDSVILTGIGALIPVGLIVLLVYWAREG
jgi:uncharacterized membrane protein YvlD (DUF360 family)